MSIADIFETLTYGPAREPTAPALDWLERHAPALHLVVENCTVPPQAGEYFESVNPATGRPLIQIAHGQKLGEIVASLQAGAREMDVVISRPHVLRGDWQALYDEVRDFRATCGAAHLKTILATGELGTLCNVGRASLVCMMAGADFVKTSTGKESVNATLPVGLVMARAIRDYYERTGRRVGLKPAGGIRSARQALDWLALMKEELGDPWLHPELFRIGASGLLSDIERQLAHTISGRYAAAHHHPMP